MQLRLDTSWLGPGSVRAGVWLTLFQLGSGWLVVLVSQKNELGSGFTLARELGVLSRPMMGSTYGDDALTKWAASVPCRDARARRCDLDVTKRPRCRSWAARKKSWASSSMATGDGQRCG
jgi:hypothetical protein